MARTMRGTVLAIPDALFHVYGMVGVTMKPECDIRVIEKEQADG
jgi:hypothetical protein